MKTIMLALCSLLILTSCGQEESGNQLDIEQKLQLVKNDPLFLDYLEGIEDITKILSENGKLKIIKFSDIIKTKAKADKYCNVDKTIFNGDDEMIAILDAKCKAFSSGKAFLDKYPFFAELSKDERTAFLSHPDLEFERDVEVLKRKEMERIEAEGMD